MHIYFGKRICEMGGEIYEFMEMWLKCGTCGFVGRWRFRPGYDLRCGLLGDGDSALLWYHMVYDSSISATLGTPR